MDDDKTMDDENVLVLNKFRKGKKAQISKSSTQNQIASFARVPGYLNSESKDNEGVIDHDGMQFDASVALPNIEVILPMNHRGETIEDELADPIIGWGKPEPYSDNLSAAASESRKVTVMVSVKIHGWEFGWQEEMQPEPATTPVASTESQVIAEEVQ